MVNPNEQLSRSKKAFLAGEELAKLSDGEPIVQQEHDELTARREQLLSEVSAAGAKLVEGKSELTKVNSEKVKIQAEIAQLEALQRKLYKGRASSESN